MFSLIWIGLNLAVTISPQPAEVWEFVGIEISQNVGCINDPMVEARHVWIRCGEDHRVQRAALVEELRQRYGSRLHLRSFQVRVGSPRAIALVRKTLRCTRYSGPTTTVQSYRWYAGDDQAAVLRELETNRRITPDVQAFEVVLWIDIGADLGRLRSATG